MLITDASLKRKSTVFVLMILFIVVGMYSYITLPRESDPDITIPYVLVVTEYEGVAPEDVESLITLPIERKLKGIKNVKEIRATSSEGASIIVVEFIADTDIDNAMQWVRDKVDQAKGDLPADLENDPMIMEINLSEFPIMKIAIHGDVPEYILKEVAEDLKDEIESVQGVLEVVINGGRERQIRVVFDQERLTAYGLSFSEIAAAVQRENVNIPGGTMDMGGGKYLLRIPGEFKDPAIIDNLVLLARNGKPIYLKDVAHVEDTFEDRESYSRLNGDQAVSIEIKKRAGENIIEVSDRVKAILDIARTLVPAGIQLTVTEDQSDDIRMMVEELENNIMSGLVLVVLVLFMFLGKRSSFFVAAAIPFSMLLSFTVLQIMGITLNMVVLFSLILALGMLVDNAIVIVENIYRHIQEGKERNVAASIAAAEVGWPIISSTVTTLCAFAPMLFWPDIMGEFMRFLPLTLIITLTSSLFVALVFNPVICAVFMSKKRDKAYEDDGRDSLFVRMYVKSLDFALRRRWVAVLGAFGGMFVILMLFGAFNSGVELFPDTQPKRAYVGIKAPEGTRLEVTDGYVNIVEQMVMAEPDVKYIIADSGITPSGEEGSSRLSNHGRVSIRFHEKDDREGKSSDVLDRLREKLQFFPGAEIKVEKEENGPPVGDPVSIEIGGEDVSILERLTNQVKAEVKEVYGIVDLKDNLVKSKPEISVRVDREKAALLGLSTADISYTLKAAIGGYKLGVYREGDDEYDIVARLPEERRRSVADIANLLVPNSGGNPIPLSEIATVETGTGYGSIKRKDGKRVVTVSAGVEGRNSNDALQEIMQKVAKIELPNGYSIKYSGEQEEQQKATAFLEKAFIIALFMIALVLVTQFNSIRQSGIVLTSVVLSLSGVLMGLLIMRMPFGIIMTGVGVISLAGVVVNNAIVLIDYANQLRASGMEPDQAIRTAGRTRLRPVLLTAVTTILGMLPMATGVSFSFRRLAWEIGSETAEWWSSMAVAIIFGLSFATVLTLIVVPVLYSYASTGIFRRKKA